MAHGYESMVIILMIENISSETTYESILIRQWLQWAIAQLRANWLLLKDWWWSNGITRRPIWWLDID